MARMLTPQMLEADNQLFAGTGGVSMENQCRGFIPGFMDRETGVVYHSCWADGRPAPFHALDGLPAHLIRERDHRGHITAVKASVIAGFIHQGCFYTREQAACCLD
ncbi:MAG: hypothetical protein WAV07_00485 [Candidatus Contendobacter sp.]